MIPIDQTGSYAPGTVLHDTRSGAVFRIPEHDPGLVGGMIWEEIFMLSRRGEDGRRVGTKGTVTLYLRASSHAANVEHWVADPPSSGEGPAYPPAPLERHGNGVRATFRAGDSVAWKAGLLSTWGAGLLVLAEAAGDRVDVIARVFDDLLDSVQFMKPGDRPEAEPPLQGAGRPRPLRWSHCYSFLFFLAARISDGTAPEESAAVAEEMLGEWEDELSREQLREMMLQGLSWLDAAWSDRTVHDEIEFILQLIDGDPSFDRARRNRLLAALGRIMAADARLDDDEITLHRYLRQEMLQES